MKKIILLSLSLWITACGGGSGSNDEPPVNNNPQTSRSVLQSSSSSSTTISTSSLTSSTSSSSSSQQINSSSTTSFQVSIDSNTGGQISPSGTQTVNPGSQLNFSITPDSGFYIASASGCGGSLQNQTYSTGPINQDCEISVQFNRTGFVFIPDIDLKNAIRDELNLASNSEITTTQMQNLHNLTLNDAPNSLTGLESATQLISLTIENEDFSRQSLDLSPISVLSSIDHLNLHGINQLNLSSIQSLTMLDELLVSDSSIVNLSAIAGLTQLKTLYLNSVGLTEAPIFLSQFTQLNELSLSDNPLGTQDIAILETLRPRTLLLNNTEIDDLQFLAQNNRLNYLSIEGTPVFDLSPLLTSGLGSGEFISANYSCLYSGKYANHPTIAENLRQKGVVLLDYFQESGTYGDYSNPRICNNHLQNLTGNMTANYQNNQVLINWTLSTNNQSNLTCEVYFDLQNQQPRNPYKVINNCHQLNQDSMASTVTQAPVSLVVWDHYGSKKIIQGQLLSSVPNGVYLHSYDFGQTIVKPDAKLIPGKAALLRLHVLSNQTQPVPDISVTAELNSVNTSITTTKPGSLSSSKNFRSANAAYKANIPGELMQPGLSIRINLNGQEKVITPVFGESNTLYLTLIPIKIQNSTGLIPPHNSIQNAFLQLWPFSDIQIKNRAVYTADVTNAEDMNHLLYDISELQSLDGENSHYYGFFSSNIYDDLNFNSFGGIAFIGDTVGIGKDNDTGFSIMLHELGHNFNLRHIDCGNPVNADIQYPYTPNTIGSLGISRDLQTFYNPTTYADIMSYCSNQFVSDYSYEKAQDYLEANPSRPFSVVSSSNRAAKSSAHNNLFVSGLINTNTAELRRILPSTKAVSGKLSGGYSLRVIDTDNIEQRYYFDSKQLDHIKNAPEFFSLTIPYTEISRLEILKGNQLLYRQDQPTSVASNSVAARKISPSPEAIINTSNVCLYWDQQTYDTASLQLKLATGNLLTLFMDRQESPYCVDYVPDDPAENWNIILRKGLQVQEFHQPID